MTDPGIKPREHLDEATLTTGVMRGVQQIESLDRGYVEPADDPVYVKEPLFSKKVLFGWGIATLIVWFAFTFIVPAVVQSVKAAIETSMGTPGTNSRTVIQTPDGGTVTIIRTKSGVTVDRKGPGEATAPAPTVVVPAPVVIRRPDAAGAATAAPPQQPTAPVPPTGKK